MIKGIFNGQVGCESEVLLINFDIWAKEDMPRITEVNKTILEIYLHVDFVIQKFILRGVG